MAVDLMDGKLAAYNPTKGFWRHAHITLKLSLQCATGVASQGF